MKKYLYFLLISLGPIWLFGQSDYYEIDSLITVGVDVVDGGDMMNAKVCQIEFGKITKQLTPYEVVSYGFKNGRVYVSKMIPTTDSVKLVFLERLVDGKTTLYYYRNEKAGTYYIEKDSSLFTELPRFDINQPDLKFNDKLSSLTSDCQNITDATKLVKYTNSGIVLLIKRYNACEQRPFPFFKFGVILGPEITKLHANRNIDDLYSDPSLNPDFTDFNFENEFGFFAGLFIDIPIFPSDFSIHTDIYINRHSYTYHVGSSQTDLDLTANIASLSCPILFRYTMPYNTFRPFFNAGFCLAYNFINKSSLFKATIKPHSIEIDNVASHSLFSDFSSGYSVGSGIEYKYNYKRSIFIELRFNKYYSLYSSGALDTSVFQILTSINF